MRISDWSSDVCSSDLADDAVVRHVGDVRLADDRRHVVLAVGFKADVAQQHHLVVAFDFLEGALQEVEGVHGVAFEELLVGLHHRSEEHTSELQSLMRISYAVFCLKKKNKI